MTPSGAPHLVIGDEELLVTRGVAAAVARPARTDPDATTEEYRGRRADASAKSPDAVSPSLFGGRAGASWSAMPRTPRRTWPPRCWPTPQAPEPDVVLVLTHAGGAKGKALADGLREAGARGHRRREDHPAPGAGRLRPGRDPPARRQVRRGRRRGAARGRRQRPAGAGRGLLAARRRHRRADRRRRPWPATTGAGPRSAASPSPTPRWWATCRPRWRRCAGRCTSASTRCRSPTRWPTGSAPCPGWPAPGGATPTSWPARSACRRGRSNGRSARPGAGRPKALVEAMRVAAECNAAVKGGVGGPGVRAGAGRLRAGRGPGRRCGAGSGPA